MGTFIDGDAGHDTPAFTPGVRTTIGTDNRGRVDARPICS